MQGVETAWNIFWKKSWTISGKFQW